MSHANDQVALRRLLQGDGSMDPDEEKMLVKQILAANPECATELTFYYLHQKHQVDSYYRSAREELAQLKESPYLPARVIRIEETTPPTALVALDNGRRAIVTIGKDIRTGELAAGSGVLLNQKMNLLLKTFDGMPVDGDVLVFDSYAAGGRIRLRCDSSGEIVCEMAAMLAQEKLEPGDLVLLDRSYRMAMEQLPKADGKEYAVTVIDPPDISFDDIGGLDDVAAEIIENLDMAFLHPEIVKDYHLRPMKGMLLIGKPGLGKTLVAKAIANYASLHFGADRVRFINVPAGSQRNWLYGATEDRIRQIFNTARTVLKEKPGSRVIIFFDEIDNIGTRSAGFGSEIDSRVMAALLYELDGLQSEENILVVGASNREDLIDAALLRPKRFGDRIFRLTRPDREAARDIFSKYLTVDLPYYRNGSHASNEILAEEILEAAVSYLYSPGSQRARLAELTFRDGSKRDVVPADVISGAMIENAVRIACQESAVRSINGPGGIRTKDVIQALEQELDSVTAQLKPQTVKDYIDLEDDKDIVRVQIAPKPSIMSAEL